MGIGGMSGDERDKNLVSRGTWETERILTSNMIYEGKRVSRPCWHGKIFWNIVLILVYHCNLFVSLLFVWGFLYLFLFNIQLQLQPKINSPTSKQCEVRTNKPIPQCRKGLSRECQEAVDRQGCKHKGQTGMLNQTQCELVFQVSVKAIALWKL